MSSSAYSHVIEGIMKKGRMKQRQCPTEMIIFVPVDQTIRKVFLLLRNAHNHPVHPRFKPSQSEALKLISAVDAAGKIGLTVSKLLKGECISNYHVAPYLNNHSSINVDAVQWASCRRCFSILCGQETPS
jgi:hypothetical protein